MRGRVRSILDLFPLKLSLPPGLRDGWAGGQSLAPLSHCWNRAQGFREVGLWDRS